MVQLDDGGEVARGDGGDLIEGRLRCSSKGFCFAIREDGGEDIYIRDHQLNHAWNGDRVLVRITREGGRRRSPEGGVQCVLERNTTSLLAQLDRQNEQLLALPLDDRLLATIELPDEDASHLTDQASPSVVEVAVDRFPVAQYAARGHVARPLPLDAGPEGDRELLLTKAHLHQRAAAPRATSKAPSTKKRVDLTAQPALLLRGWSSDQAPCLPAVHVEPHDGGCRLWIHAPSVAERINAASSIDEWLQERGEALCLGDTWQPLLSNTLHQAAKFSPGTPQDAMSLRVDVDAEGKLGDWEFQLSTVQPVAVVTGEAMAALATRKPKARTVPAVLKPLKNQLNQLETLLFCARNLHQRFLQDGAIALDLPNPPIETLGDLRCARPDACRHQWLAPLCNDDPNAILAVLIRAADQCWAMHAADLQLPALVLEAPAADGSMLMDVAKTAIGLDLPLELDADGTPTAADLSKAFQDSPLRRMLELQMRQALSDPLVRRSGVSSAHRNASSPDSGSDQGEESTAEAHEGASAVAGGAPWCCPTLHTTDLINQRVLSALLNDGKDRPTVRHKEKVKLGRRGSGQAVTWPVITASQEQKLLNTLQDRHVLRINNRRRQVAELEKDLVAMAQARSAEPLVGEQHVGHISGVQSYGFFVELPPAMVEGMVHVSSLNDDWYEYRSRQNRLVGRRNRRVYQLGDEVTVRVVKVDVLRNQIDLDIVATEPSPAEDGGSLPVAVSEA
ncbi:MAG: RNB domain-containing ribonuclease [Synechococcus sp.]